MAPHMDDIRCKHCGSLIAQLPMASVVGRFTLACPKCKILRVVWPAERKPTQVYVSLENANP